jgi:F-type H+-transporting ATPase subunit epsilon
MNFWRAVGLNYVQYSNISARLVCKSLKPQLQTDALKRDVVNIKFTKWEAGKADGSLPKKTA